MNDNVIPEYKCNSFLDVYDGAELYQVDKNGIEILIAVFNEIDGKFVPIKQETSYEKPIVNQEKFFLNINGKKG